MKTLTCTSAKLRYFLNETERLSFMPAESDVSVVFLQEDTEQLWLCGDPSPRASLAERWRLLGHVNDLLRFVPSVTYHAELDWVEFVMEDVTYVADPVDSCLVVYWSTDNKIVGFRIEGASRFRKVQPLKKLLEAAEDYDRDKSDWTSRFYCIAKNLAEGVQVSFLHPQDTPTS